MYSIMLFYFAFSLTVILSVSYINAINFNLAVQIMVNGDDEKSDITSASSRRLKKEVLMKEKLINEVSVLLRTHVSSSFVFCLIL